MKRKIKRVLAVFVTVVMMASLLAVTAYAGNRSLYKRNAGSNSNILTTSTISQNGYYLVHDGSSGYVQYNQTHRDTGCSPFGSPYVYSGQTSSQPIQPVPTGVYRIVLTGTGVGHAELLGISV